MNRRRLLLAVLCALLAANLYFAATLPATAAESAIYTRYVSKPLAQCFTAAMDPAIGSPYILLARAAKWVGGVSEFTLRFPAVFGAFLFALALWRLPWQWALPLILTVANPWNYQVFCTAAGRGLAWGLLALAIQLAPRRRISAGILLGMALASVPPPLAAAIALVVAAIALTRARNWLIVDEFLVPAILAALLLLLPSIFALEKPKPADAENRATRALLRNIPKDRLVSICASAPLEPAVNFYRRRFHMNWLRPAPEGGADQECDYYLLLPGDESLAARRGLRTVYKKEAETLAAR